MARILTPTFAACCFLFFFWAISLHNLTIVPRVYEDEPWQASTGWKLATTGIFGSDVFVGRYGMEHNYYGFMPLHPLILATIFRAAGLGLFQDRYESVAMGVLILALTYSLARRLFQDARIGLLAILFLIFVPLTGLTYIQRSGILLIDMARLARYDMVVPVLGLASLHAYLSARQQDTGRWYFLSGLLAGLSSQAHLYGLFWLPVLLVLLFWDHRRKMNRALGYALLGFIVVWLPYLAYVLGDLYDWRGQTRGYANRFDLLNLQWYLNNLLNEYHRYGPGLGRLGPNILLRVGFWSALVVLPLSLFALARRALRLDDRSARVIVVPLFLFPLLFAFLIYLKLVNYTITFVPLAAIAAAWGGVMFWNWAGRTKWSRWMHLALTVLLVAISIEGATRLAAIEAEASTTTPYYQFIGAVRQYIPAGSRILGLHNYWFGLDDFDYRSFIVPLSWTDPNNEPRPLTFDEALTQVAPDIVLLDDRMRGYFTEIASINDSQPAQFYNWLKNHDAQLLGRINDSTYGLVEIYRVTR